MTAQKTLTDNETKGKPAVKLTLEQKNRRLKDTNTQLRKELSVAEKRLEHWKLTRLDRLEPPMTLEEYQEFTALYKEVLKTRNLLDDQLFYLCKVTARLTWDLIPRTHDEDEPLYWLNRLTHLHEDMIWHTKDYKRGAFELLDRIVRQCRYGVEFVRSLQKGGPEVEVTNEDQ